MAVTNKIFIPTFISSINYEPVRTLPHLYFYNGLKECEEYFIQHYPSGSTSSIVNSSQTSFPYLDYYDGLTPNSSSNSLLFFNELPAYGVTPTGSLYTEYWDTYVSLLYNPRTRLFNASAIIPLADYFEMELNDIVQWRGNYYHLRAINEYNLKDGTCKIELLGPIIRDAVSEEIPPTPPISNCIFNFSSSVEPVVTTTTTAGPTTTTTTAAPTQTCNAYIVGTRDGASFFFTYYNCFTNSNQTVSINQNNRSFYFCGFPVSAVPPNGYLNLLGTCTAPVPTTTTTTTAAPISTTTGGPFVVDYLIVAGGGGGGSRHAGGGGAGGYLTGSLGIGGSYSVVVGAGGSGAVGPGIGTNGNNSSVFGITAHGGGYGGGTGFDNGAVGGSGGGALGVNGAIGGASSGSQGFVGGNGASFAGGGGGGRSQSGFIGVRDGTINRPGNGGSGSAWVDGTFRAGGGGGAGISSTQGGTQTATVAVGGIGGGGQGGNGQNVNQLNGFSGSINTGGGGGAGAGFGSAAGNGGAGGSGIVIIRYAGTPQATGGTITQTGGFTYHTFTSSGTFTK